jgi:hypothetical protein
MEGLGGSREGRPKKAGSPGAYAGSERMPTETTKDLGADLKLTGDEPLRGWLRR